MPAEESFHFPQGLADFLKALLNGRELVADEPVHRRGGARARAPGSSGRSPGRSTRRPTPAGTATPCRRRSGGTHEAGLRTALLKGLRTHAERIGFKRAAAVTAEDVHGRRLPAALAVHAPAAVPGPDQGAAGLARGRAPGRGRGRATGSSSGWAATPPPPPPCSSTWRARAEERIARKKAKEEVGRKTATRKLRLPGKLADCAREARDGTEIFIVEGDSAGGSAKQARNRETQAILPLRGKILNVASATADKLAGNKELADLVTALGCGTGKHWRPDDLRYDKVVIMTDADVDGAHIAALLMTFFFRELPKLIERGHLYLAQPPLYRLSHGGTIAYARDEADRERLLATVFKGKKNVEIGRFKGLGEMNPPQLKETTMDPARRQLLQVSSEDVEGKPTAQLVEELMGRRPELRLAFIQENAALVKEELDV